MFKFLLIVAGYFITINGNVCNYKRDILGPLDSGFDNSPVIYENLIICTNVSSDFLLSYQNYQKYGQFDKIFLEVIDSTIPLLPPNSLSKFSAVTRLNLSNLGIEKISKGAFNGLSKLRRLSLRSNKLTTIVTGVFNNLESLQILDLSNNLIDNIEDDSFSSCTRLTYLLLENNKLKVVEKNLTRNLVLDVLDVSGNPLEEFQEFATNHVGTIRAKQFPLKSFDVNISNMEVYNCDFSEGQLEVVDFGSFRWQSVFNVSSNKIVSVKNWNKMKGFYFSLSNNLIKEAELDVQVEVLDLSQNQITHLKRSSNLNDKLSRLDLSFNQIHAVPSGTFSNLIKLNSLNLTHNSIAIIETHSFIGDNSLNYLDLAHNNLERLSPASLEGLKKDVSVYINHNSIEEEDITELKKTFDKIYTE